jgi:hypothetical protein
VFHAYGASLRVTALLSCTFQSSGTHTSFDNHCVPLEMDHSPCVEVHTFVVTRLSCLFVEKIANDHAHNSGRRSVRMSFI